jgi:glycine dehydrogenase subunit 1
VATRGEFYSSYTPYQAEASQGTLQLIYEYQTMMTGLTGMDVSNASLYDGASALSEAVLMSIRANRKSRGKRVLLPASVNPVYRACTQSVVRNQGVELIEVPYCTEAGVTLVDALGRHAGEDIAALVVQQPNFFGSLEDVDALTDWAHANGALLIAVVNPMALAVLKPPGQWGQQGADIACGDGQPLGAPLSSGGPYYGFMCCKEAHVRQMPGRIVGRTVDVDGRTGFVLTLQAREQHIRRSKATSNICTNQGLVVTASTIYMAIMGPEGLRRTAVASHANTRALLRRLAPIKGVERVFGGPFFHEAVLRLNRPVQDVLAGMAGEGILGGYALGENYPELGEALLVCATETKTGADLDRYAAALSRVLAA